MFNLKRIGFFAASTILAASLALATSTTAIHATPSEDLSFDLLKDINTSGDDSSLQTLAVVGGTSYFKADDGIHGMELWKSDGTANGTSLVKDIYAGGMSGNPNSAVVIGGMLYFVATDYAHGIELWKSNGTEAGTVLVKDLRPGTYGDGGVGLSSVVGGLVVIGNIIYFAAMDATQKFKLWKSDGTESGTTLVRDIQGEVGGPFRFGVIGNTFYFSASDPTHGAELWKSDGTEIGTVLVKDIRVGTSSSLISNASPTSFGNSLYFIADDGIHGAELWKSDGTEIGTVLVKDIRVGTIGSARREQTRELTSIGNTLYFSADDGTHGTELWKSDGTEIGTVLVKDINPESNLNFGIEVTNLTDSEGVLYYRANDGVHGYELWKSDGTEQGTTLVKDINPGTGNSRPTNSQSAASITTIAGTIYFSADDGSHGYELWKSDGTESGTSLVKDIQSGVSSSSPDSPFSIGGKLYFSADDATHGIELWKSDGTSGGTVLVKDINVATDTSDPSVPVIMGDYFYFTALDGIHGYDLWKSNGTPEGTVLLKDFEPSGIGRAGALTVVGNTLFFGNIDSTHGLELWKSDGTPEGTKIVKDINPGTAWAWPESMTPIGGNLLFTANDGTNGSALWKSDGTPEGTKIVKDINPGTSISYSGSNPTVLGSNLYFSADDGVHGLELWKSDGTPEGTKIVKDIKPGIAPSYAYAVAVGNTLFISADDGVHGFELWKSDGTLEGTTLVKDIKVGPEDTYLDRQTAVGNVLFFTTDDGIHGNELWKSDGTPEGTKIVKDINPIDDGFYPDSLTAMGNTLFFSGNDGVHGKELWKSDGTENGTVLVKDIHPGVISSPPDEDGLGYLNFLTSIGNHLYLMANDGVHGNEIWRSDGTESGTVLVDDIRTGELGSTPHQMFGFKNKILLVADDGVHGDEFWIASQPVTRASIAGTATVGQILTANPGTWAGAPAPLITYKWYACSAKVGNATQTVPGTCLPISGATSRTIELKSPQAEKYIAVKVTGTSSGTNPMSWLSASTATTVKMRAAATGHPIVTGQSNVGQTMTANKGTWTGAPAPLITYKWYACSAKVGSATQTVPGTCLPISGATSRTIELKSPQAEKYIAVKVTGTSSGTNPMSWLSASTATTVKMRAAATGHPIVTGQSNVGQTMTANKGTWTGAPAPLITYKWYACSAKVGSATQTVPGGCRFISGATKATFKLTSTQRNQYVAVQVTGTSLGTAATSWLSKTSAKVS